MKVLADLATLLGKPCRANYKGMALTGVVVDGNLAYGSPRLCVRIDGQEAECWVSIKNVEFKEKGTE